VNDLVDTIDGQSQRIEGGPDIDNETDKISPTYETTLGDDFAGTKKGRSYGVMRETHRSDDVVDRTEGGSHRIV
jgi:hypothetical protein